MLYSIPIYSIPQTYTSPLSSLISGHSILHHLYADDGQMYVSFSSGDSAAALNCLQSINQSINQSHFYSANIPGKARLSGATAKIIVQR